jgi:Na+-transporting methylmalonyl-CoA/oxaloacetate decarboxylase gamma subunit
MSENLILALQITVLGMGLVFLGIIIIWGVMLALTASTSRKTESTQAIADSTAQKELRAKAAAIAVASVIAEQKQAGVSRFPIPPTALVSAWQLTMRTRQLNHEGRPKYQG